MAFLNIFFMFMSGQRGFISGQYGAGQKSNSDGGRQALEPASGPGEAGFQSVAMETFFATGWRRSRRAIQQLRSLTAALCDRSREIAMTCVVSNH
jgi:hypothetical protein